mmetsp:Transcript_29218/g.68434  ORF Transcript_29218/g.68434 Transcript_29218/m.68434 type:complete len:254 (-) Transcript_29218:185-946(-)
MFLRVEEFADLDSTLRHRNVHIVRSVVVVAIVLLLGIGVGLLLIFNDTAIFQALLCLDHYIADQNCVMANVAKILQIFRPVGRQDELPIDKVPRSFHDTRRFLLVIAIILEGCHGLLRRLAYECRFVRILLLFGSVVAIPPGPMLTVLYEATIVTEHEEQLLLLDGRGSGQGLLLLFGPFREFLQRPKFGLLLRRRIFCCRMERGEEALALERPNAGNVPPMQVARAVSLDLRCMYYYCNDRAASQEREAECL